jgi:O-antigen/teichoic acid export membrane protein
LGIFASLAYLLTVINLIVIALGQSVCARMARLFANREIPRLRRLVGKLIWFAVALGVLAFGLATVIGRPAIALIYRPEYAAHINLLLLMIVDSILVAVGAFLGFGMTAVRCFRPQMLVMTATVIATVFFTWMLIPHFGLMGAGYGLLIGSCVRAATSYAIFDGRLRRQAA